MFYFFNLLIMTIKSRLKQSDPEHGERLIYWLVAWLNTERGHLRERDGDKTRIRVLISRLHALSNALKAESLKRPAAEADEEMNEAYAKLCEAEDAVNVCTRRYKMRPLFLFKGSPEGDDRLENAYLRLAGGGVNEWQAIEVLQELVRSRLLDRLALCAQCGVKWIFRWRKDKQACGERCRQKQYESSERRKTERTSYALWYYHFVSHPKPGLKYITWQQWQKQWKEIEGAKRKRWTLQARKSLCVPLQRRLRRLEREIHRGH